MAARHHLLTKALCNLAVGLGCSVLSAILAWLATHWSEAVLTGYAAFTAVLFLLSGFANALQMLERPRSSFLCAAVFGFVVYVWVSFKIGNGGLTSALSETLSAFIASVAVAMIQRFAMKR